MEFIYAIVKLGGARIFCCHGESFQEVMAKLTPWLEAQFGYEGRLDVVLISQSDLDADPDLSSEYDPYIHVEPQGIDCYLSDFFSGHRLNQDRRREITNALKSTSLYKSTPMDTQEYLIVLNAHHR